MKKSNGTPSPNKPGGKKMKPRNSGTSSDGGSDRGASDADEDAAWQAENDAIDSENMDSSMFSVRNEIQHKLRAHNDNMQKTKVAAIEEEAGE